ncbi:MAG: DUF2207 domain-containing protein [Actinomycetota bacterium]
MAKRLPSLVGLVVGLVVLGTAPAGAQVFPGERIDRYEVDITIERDGSIVVVETIDYFFDEPRHGILRDIPTRIWYDDTYDRVYPLEILSVEASSGTPANYELEDVTTQEGSGTRLRIGDADRTISGKHTYRIRYRVERAMQAFPDHDELVWDAIGLEWTVGIEQAIVTVHAPVPIERINCSSGPYGSNAPCTVERLEGRTARFGASLLPPFQGMTVAVSLPEEAVEVPPPLLEERWSFPRAFTATPARVGGGIGVLALAIVGFVGLVFLRGRDERYAGSPVDVLHGQPGAPVEAVPVLDRTPTLAEFAPPDDIRPGQLGTLIDESANALDVSATIVDLAVRGYLRIEELEKTWMFGKPDFRLVRISEPDGDLLEYERILLTGLFRSGEVVQLSELKATFYQEFEQVQNAMYRDAVRNGWFPANPDSIRDRWRLIGMALFLVGCGVVFLAARYTTLGLVALPAPLFGLLVFFGAKAMPRRTAKGTAMKKRTEGLKMVMEVSEVELSRFAEAENIFTKLLPYAVVFGITEKWAKTFEQLGAMPDTSSWYVSSRPFAYAAFAGSVDGFTTLSSGVVGSRPASSGGSGFSGGGSSGGGGGGGGGGSW